MKYGIRSVGTKQNNNYCISFKTRQRYNKSYLFKIIKSHGISPDWWLDHFGGFLFNLTEIRTVIFERFRALRTGEQWQTDAISTNQTGSSRRSDRKKLNFRIVRNKVQVPPISDDFSIDIQLHLSKVKFWKVFQSGLSPRLTTLNHYFDLYWDLHFQLHYRPPVASFSKYSI